MAKVVRVDWTDAHGGGRSGWKDVSEAAKTETVAATSFGVLIRETTRTIVICPHFVGGHVGKPMDLDTCQADGEIAIPRKWIRKIIELGEL